MTRNIERVGALCNHHQSLCAFTWQSTIPIHMRVFHAQSELGKRRRRCWAAPALGGGKQPNPSINTSMRPPFLIEKRVVTRPTPAEARPGVYCCCCCLLLLLLLLFLSFLVSKHTTKHNEAQLSQKEKGWIAGASDVLWNLLIQLLQGTVPARRVNHAHILIFTWVLDTYVCKSWCALSGVLAQPPFWDPHDHFSPQLKD